MSIESWCKAMESSPASRITLANLIHDVESTRAHRDTLRQVLRRVIELWDKATNSDQIDCDARQATVQLSATLDKSTEQVFCTAPHFTVEEPVSRVVETEGLTEFFILKGAYGELVKPKSRFKRPPAQKFAASQLQAEATVRCGRPMAWVTKAAALEELEKSLEEQERVEEIATRIRDYVGLDHIGDGVELVEVIYSLTGCRVSAPTVVEGACRDVYRSYFKKKDPWGRTVDLASEDLADGAPEAVHPPIAVTADFDYRHLGTVRGTRQWPAEKLERKCVRPWVPADIAIVRKYIEQEPGERT